MGSNWKKTEVAACLGGGPVGILLPPSDLKSTSLCLPCCATIASSVEFWVPLWSAPVLPSHVSIRLCASVPPQSLSLLEQRGNLHAQGFETTYFSLRIAGLSMKRNDSKETWKKQDLAILVSKNNDQENRETPFNLRVRHYLPLEVLKRRANPQGYDVLLSKLAGERQPGSHCSQGWHAGTPGAHVLPERQPSLTQFQNNIAWHSTAIHNFNNLVTYKAVLMQSGADRAAEGRLCFSPSCVGNPFKVTATFAAEQTVRGCSCKQVRLACFPGGQTQGWLTVSGTNLEGLGDTACLFCFDLCPQPSCSSSSLLPLP